VFIRFFSTIISDSPFAYLGCTNILYSPIVTLVKDRAESHLFGGGGGTLCEKLVGKAQFVLVGNACQLPDHVVEDATMPVIRQFGLRVES